MLVIAHISKNGKIARFIETNIELIIPELIGVDKTLSRVEVVVDGDDSLDTVTRTVQLIQVISLPYQCFTESSELQKLLSELIGAELSTFNSE